MLGAERPLSPAALAPGAGWSDRLVCGWAYGSAFLIGRGVGLTAVEAVEDGWWYTAPVPGGRRVLAFLTNADLPAARIAHDSVRLIECVDAAREIRAILAMIGSA
jgi:hypothetical protein